MAILEGCKIQKYYFKDFSYSPRDDWILFTDYCFNTAHWINDILLFQHWNERQTVHIQHIHHFFIQQLRYNLQNRRWFVGNRLNQFLEVFWPNIRRKENIPPKQHKIQEQKKKIIKIQAKTQHTMLKLKTNDQYFQEVYFVALFTCNSFSNLCWS